MTVVLILQLVVDIDNGPMYGVEFDSCPVWNEEIDNYPVSNVEINTIHRLVWRLTTAVTKVWRLITAVCRVHRFTTAVCRMWRLTTIVHWVLKLTTTVCLIWRLTIAVSKVWRLTTAVCQVCRLTTAVCWALKLTTAVRQYSWCIRKRSQTQISGPDNHEMGRMRAAKIVAGDSEKQGHGQIPWNWHVLRQSIAIQASLSCFVFYSSPQPFSRCTLLFCYCREDSTVLSANGNRQGDLINTSFRYVESTSLTQRVLCVSVAHRRKQVPNLFHKNNGRKPTQNCFCRDRQMSSVLSRNQIVQQRCWPTVRAHAFSKSFTS
ncbi:hypothetical protein RRG08_015451 [Elysia crispata]|uniref:Uncharacterized protein n=1 Tax=Elysia crispata TaxID=231223 RepID=A0AAE0YI79_9GAST|nr:hypothetical protein RRG08_015451 [Elysia crispata]